MSGNDIFYNLQELLGTARQATDVPGAVAAVYHKGEIYQAAAGVVNFRTGVAVTQDSVFQIGSVTKSLTATLVMMLVEEGKLDLEAPVTKYLDHFNLAQKEKTALITLRHLLSHTSGIDGDLIADTGRGEDCLEKFIRLLDGVNLLHEPGEFFSYCNVGYIILGRIIELVEGAPFDKVLKERLLVPLGLDHAVMFAEEALFFNTAIGHVMGPRGLDHAETAFAPRSNAPSGTVLGMSARDLLMFARFHMNKGVTAKGKRLVQEKTIAEMQKPQVRIPLSGRYTSWGLGWMQYYWDGADMTGHDGGWMGMSAYLRFSPRHDFAAVLLANGPGALQLYRAVMEPFLLAGAGFRAPALPAAPDQKNFDLSRYCGRYVRHGQSIDITLQGSRLKACLGGEYMDGATMEFDVNLIEHNRASCSFDGIPMPVSGYFPGFSGKGRPAYFHVTERAFRRRD
ncbi:serine hydrolase domain-containing protein [Emcibacter nanhaiensis]|uniref:Beta-lactamase family protein n=1 Tax=Emcibacter nanhaiensis TaxID=1505037 RepID=A0A501PGX2_9PROT|nr:serine hydrolase domain-containing protein [Emcibacter nanhaiensis]TPD59282.1 beta-lactamase family protein [Emcibacter nanhaiensis]